MICGIEEGTYGRGRWQRWWYRMKEEERKLLTVVVTETDIVNIM